MRTFFGVLNAEKENKCHPFTLPSLLILNNCYSKWQNVCERIEKLNILDNSPVTLK